MKTFSVTYLTLLVFAATPAFAQRRAFMLGKDRAAPAAEPARAAAGESIEIVKEVKVVAATDLRPMTPVEILNEAGASLGIAGTTQVIPNDSISLNIEESGFPKSVQPNGNLVIDLSRSMARVKISGEEKILIRLPQPYGRTRSDKQVSEHVYLIDSSQLGFVDRSIQFSLYEYPDEPAEYRFYPMRRVFSPKRSFGPVNGYGSYVAIYRVGSEGREVYVGRGWTPQSLDNPNIIGVKHPYLDRFSSDVISQEELGEYRNFILKHPTEHMSEDFLPLVQVLNLSIQGRKAAPPEVRPPSVRLN